MPVDEDDVAAVGVIIRTTAAIGCNPVQILRKANLKLWNCRAVLETHSLGNHDTAANLFFLPGQILPFGPADAISLNIRIPADRPSFRIRSITEIAVPGQNHLLIQ